MLTLWLIGLTILNVLAILIKGRKPKVSLKKYVYRQSTLHQVAKLVLPTNAELKSRKPTQYKKYIENQTVKVITAPDGKAYWVKNNKFFCAEIEDGIFDPELGKEINTNELSKKEIDKLLFILDNLNRGMKNDSSNSGN